MPKPSKGPRLAGSPAHERLLLANLATSLFEHGRIKTTQAKARRLRPYAEKLITSARKGDLASRREVMKVIRDKSIVHALFTDIGPRFVNRPGGYTRIVKVGNRSGDNAPMAVIELVESLTVAQTAVGEAEGATRRSARTGEGTSLAKAPAVEQEAAPEGTTMTQQSDATEVTSTDAFENSASDVSSAEAGDQAAEEGASAQTEGATEESQAEGDAEPDKA